MRILGVTNNDAAGAALIVDGKISGAISEERFTRTKDQRGWPRQSIDFLLNNARLALSDIDVLAYGWSAGFNPGLHLALYASRLDEAGGVEAPEAQAILRRAADEHRNDFRNREDCRVFFYRSGIRELELLDHHECHGLGAWSLSPFDDAIVLTADGRGDFQSLTLGEMRAGVYTSITRETSFDSLGYFFGRVTKLLGFVPNRHEGKLTGLAACGNPSKGMPLIERMIECRGGRLRGRYGAYYAPYYDDLSQDLLDAAARYTREDIAAAAQKQLEDIVCGLLSMHVAHRGLRRLCLAGGVFANVRLNQRIAELDFVDDLFVLPCMGDGGLPLAAAALSSFRRGSRPSLVTMCLGSPAESTCDWESSRVLTKRARGASLIACVVEALMRGKAVGLVRGRDEFGPRALCHRSILCDARSRGLADELNRRLRRNDFMPFAPVTTSALASRCFENWHANDLPSRYMARTFEGTPYFRVACEAAVHVDGTARPQVVHPEQDPFMVALIHEWHAATGSPALINTSFNIHEEPIVRTLDEALKALEGGVVGAILFNDEVLLSLPTV